MSQIYLAGPKGEWLLHHHVALNRWGCGYIGDTGLFGGFEFNGSRKLEVK